MQAFVPENELRRHRRPRRPAGCESVLHAAKSHTPARRAKLQRLRQPIFPRRMRDEESRDAVPPEVVSAMMAKAADSIVRSLRLPIIARWKNASRDAYRFQASRVN